MITTTFHWVIFHIQTFCNVLLFPPLSSFRRFLIHQLVEKTYSCSDLKTFSIGQDHGRRTVVCYRSLLESRNTPPGVLSNDKLATMVVNKETKTTSTSSQHAATPSGSKKKSMPPLILYRPPAARNDNHQKSSSETHPAPISATNLPSSNKTTPVSQRSQVPSQSSTTSLGRKIRRPDQQMYVPRARRSESNQSIDTTCSAKQQSQPSPPTKPPPSERPSTSPIILKRDKFQKDITPVTGNKPVVELPRNRSISPIRVEEVNSGDLNSTCSSLSCSSQEFKEYTQCVDGSMENENVEFLSEVLASSPSNVIDPCCRINETSDENSSAWNSESSMNSFDVTSVHNKNEVVNEVETRRLSVECDDTSNKESDVAYCSKRKSDTVYLENKDHKSKQIHVIDGIAARLTANGDLSLSATVDCRSIDGFNGFEDCNGQNTEESDWETLFDDDGNSLEPSLLDELSKSVGEVKVCAAANDYRSYQTIEERSNDGECIIEIYGFPAEYKTRDLLNIFAAYRNRAGFHLKWVDDTHALGIFDSPIIADEVLQCELPCVKTRPLKMAIPESKVKARTIPTILPPVVRPKTCSVLARRLVSGALGLRIPTDEKKREQEKLILKEARDQKRLAAKQREAAWEGTIGS